MTFGPRHYVPVLKTKRGEKAALRQMTADLRERITPLLEIPQRTEKALPLHLNTAFTDLAASAALYPRCFLDVREIEADGPTAAATVFQRAADAGIVFAPVTGISRTADVAEALSHRQFGLALRLTRSEFEGGGLNGQLSSFLDARQIQPEEVDLIVDLGPVEELISEGIAALTIAFLSEVPEQARWRTLTVSACSFPLGMGAVERHSHALVERTEWVAWKERLYDARFALERLPTFSDCAIQHPLGVEGFNFRVMQVSAAIRYTLEQQWLLVKGEGTRTVPAALQFPELARRLVYGDLEGYYAGTAHCFGCTGIKMAADGLPKRGSPGVWRRIGTIHHMSAVMQAIDSLAWP